jgi:glycosyltransferase involved in cell wall biosynthesis
MNLLTVVIPFYKRSFLDAALGSLAAQTDKNFKVFIGDDASPEDPSEIIQTYRSRLDLTYQRFSDNLGRTSLVGHWNRCVRQTDSEWVWLFSDDDVAGENCVEVFRRSWEETKGDFDVYRYNTRTIDDEGKVIDQHPPHPRIEETAEFALAKILSQRFSFAVEYIFRRSAFVVAGGFVPFPLAWCSDDASWISFARNKKIYTMDAGRVSWRKSGINISSPRPELVRLKLGAFQLYLKWLQLQFPEPEFQKRLKVGLRRGFLNQIPHWGGNPDLMTSLKFWLFFVGFDRHPNFRLLRTLLGLKSKFARSLGRSSRT